MLCYRDITFCPESIYKRCRKAEKCDSPLTEEVIKAAEKWWGDADGGPPIAQFVDDPECLEEVNDA